jgi:hypothetical protein
MTFLARNPEPGDWIKTTRPIKLGLSDYLMGDNAGIKPGTRGVVTRNCGWNAVEVLLDNGLFGSVTARVKVRDLRVVRRGAGVTSFRQSTSRINAVRFGVAMAFVLPIAYFALMWFVRGGTRSGLVVALLDSAIYGAFDLLTYALSNPVNAVIYIAIVSAAARFAFRA